MAFSFVACKIQRGIFLLEKISKFLRPSVATIEADGPRIVRP